jgi:hypothetical protein
MRLKIIIVNGGIVLILSLLSFFLLRSSLTSATSDPSAQRQELNRIAKSARSRLALDGLHSLQWLREQAGSESVKAVFSVGTQSARQEAASASANTLQQRALQNPVFDGMAPTMILFVDEKGIGLGRDGSTLMRGEPLADSYPGLSTSLKTGAAANDVWAQPKRSERLLVSYAPIRGQGGVIGALILGTPINDARLTRTSEFTSGQSIGLFGSQSSQPLAIGGKRLSGFTSAQLETAITAARAGEVSYQKEPIEGFIFAAFPVDSYQTSAVLVASMPASSLPNLNAFLWPILAVGLFGLLLVIVGANALGQFISRPVAELEEGILLVINGDEEIRFELEHEELGGLASRINGLISYFVEKEES